MEQFLSILVPLTVTIYTYPIISRSSTIQKLPLYLKLCLSLALGSSLLIIILTFWSIFVPFGFSIFSRLVFYLMLILSIYSVWKISPSKKNIQGHLLNLRVFTKEHKNTFYLIILVSLIYIFNISIAPVASSDVVESYLPFARSIIIENRAPLRNYYDNSAFVFPPVGTPTLFAFFYAISGNLQSDSFRFFNVPFYLGFLLLSYALMRHYLNSDMSLLGILLISSFPLMEDTLILSTFYPDIIFSFYVLLAVWLILYLVSKTNYKKSILILIIFGLCLASSLIFKYQGIYLWLLILMIFGFIYLPVKWKALTFIITYLPWWINQIVGGQIFVAADIVTLIIFQILGIGGYLLGLEWGLRIHEKFKIRYLLIAVMTLLGGVYIFRNYFIFGGFEDKFGYNYEWISKIREYMSIRLDGGNSITAWSILFSPILALFFLVPKLIGSWQSLFNRKYYFPLFFLLIYYCWWVIYLGNASSKWLVPIVPFLSLMIIVGLKKLISRVSLLNKVVWSSTIFMIFSSKYIFWNFAALNFGQSAIRTGDNVNLIPRNLIADLTVKTIYLLTSRLEYNLTDLFYLLPLFIIPIFLIISIGKILKEKYIIIFITLLFLISYGYIIIKVSNGKITNFSTNERHLLYDYWGQSKYLEPYLKEKAKSSDVVLTFAPPTGFSYYTNLKNINLEYGYQIYQLYPIFNETNLSKIHQFFKEKNIRFVAVRYYAESEIRFNKLKEITRIFDIMEDPAYAKLIFNPKGDNYWYLYEII